MASSNVTSVVNHFSYAAEGFSTTTTSSILASATTVPLSSVTGLTDGNVFVGIIEPGQLKEQTFTGTVDTGTSSIIDVVWTRGSDVAHSGGVTVADYVTGTAHNMVTKGLLREHAQTGYHTLTSNATITSSKFITALNDTNGNELFKVSPTASAVNEFTVANAATGNGPTLSATGSDSNIDINITPKGTGHTVITNPYNPYKFNAYRSSAWTAASGVGKVSLNAEVYDTNNNFDTATGKYTVPVTGYYHFSAKVGYSGNASGAGQVVYLYVNGGTSVYTLYQWVDSYSGAFTRVIGGDCIIPLTAADYVELYFYSNGMTGAVNVTGMSGYLISV